MIFNAFGGQSGYLGASGISFPILSAALSGFEPAGTVPPPTGFTAATGPTGFAGGTPANFTFSFAGRPFYGLGGTTAIGTQTGSQTYREISRTFVPMGTPIPEPSAALLYAACVGAIGLHLRRRSAAPAP